MRSGSQEIDPTIYDDPSIVCTKSQAEQDRFYHRLAYLLAKGIQERKRAVTRRVVGECVILKPTFR